MGISVERFFDLFLEELNQNSALHKYYKFHIKDNSYEFRKVYFIQRLSYIQQQIGQNPNKVWDCGCGYGTSAIFLALNGYNVHGTTLEFYYDEINARLQYWQQFGNLDQLSFSYENLFDSPPAENSYDTIITQDTLHHLEPIADALTIFSKTLKKGGKMIVIEENGCNVVQNLKLYKQRGNKRIITIYDEKLGKDILLGNENIRGVGAWKKLFESHHLLIDTRSIQYIRLLPPFFFKKDMGDETVRKEQNFWTKIPLFKKFLFFGINFTACINENSR